MAITGTTVLFVPCEQEFHFRFNLKLLKTRLELMTMTASPSVQLHEIFKFLAQSMQYPDANWFNDNFLNLYAKLLHDLEWEDKEQFVSFFSDQYLEALQVEYTRLFITAVPQVIAPLYASLYLDDMLNGPTTKKTRQFYLSHGVDIADNDFPDNLIFELDFVALLEQEKDGGAEIFLKELFRPWFGLFKENVLQGSDNYYYRTTVQLIDYFICPEIDD